MDNLQKKISDIERIMRIFRGIYIRTTVNKPEHKYWYGKKICDEWLNNPINFYNWAMANGYKEDLTIDRIDNKEGYCPENCRWVTRKENSERTEHKRKYIQYKGKVYYIGEIEKIFGIKGYTVLSRINAGWDIDRAFTELPNVSKRK